MLVRRWRGVTTFCLALEFKRKDASRGLSATMSDDDYGDDTFEDEASPSTSQPTRPRKPAGRGSTGSRGRPASTRDKLRAINDEQSNRGERGGRSTVKDRLRALNAEADGRSERSGAGDGMSALLSAAADGSGRKNGEEDSDARSNADGGGKSGAAPGRYDDVDTGVPLSKMLVDDKYVGCWCAS